MVERTSDLTNVLIVSHLGQKHLLIDNTLLQNPGVNVRKFKTTKYSDLALNLTESKMAILNS